MKIGQMLVQQGGSLSFEFFPPKDAPGEQQLFRAISELVPLNPTFVSVTYGAGGSTSKNTRQAVERILRETSLVPMPHLTCINQSEAELSEILDDYQGLGVENVLALRGDPPEGVECPTPTPNVSCYAKDLVRLVTSRSAFSTAVAVYPEGHPESPSLETDMDYTKDKIDAGADFGITQMFFDNRYFYDFMERAERAGITVPILAGIMPITNINRIQKFSETCGTTLPAQITERFTNKSLTDEEARSLGVEIATEQCADLLANGVRYFHFYTLNRSRAVTEIVNNLKLSQG